MYFKTKSIKGKKYKYAVKSFRLPNKKIVSLERIYKNDLNKFFEERELEKNAEYTLKTFGADHIITKEIIKELEKIKINYKEIIKKLSKTSLKDLLDRFTANFTYESNALEGNSLTLKD